MKSGISLQLHGIDHPVDGSSTSEGLNVVCKHYCICEPRGRHIKLTIAVCELLLYMLTQRETYDIDYHTCFKLGRCIGLIIDVLIMTSTRI